MKRSNAQIHIHNMPKGMASIELKIGETPLWRVDNIISDTVNKDELRGMAFCDPSCNPLNITQIFDYRPN